MHSFHVAHFFVLQCFYIVPFVYSFHVASFFVLQCFYVVPFVYSFHAAPFSVLHSFHVAVFISSTFLVLYFFHNALSHGNLLITSCCGLLRLHVFVLRFSHVAHFHFYCIFFILHFTRLYFLLVISSESIYNPLLPWVLNEWVIRTQI